MSSHVFALFRDDVNIQEAGEWVSSQREESSIELKKRQEESKEGILKFEQEKVIIPEEKEASPSVSVTKRMPSSLIRKIVAGVTFLAIVVVIVFGNKRLFGNRSHND